MKHLFTAAASVAVVLTAAPAFASVQDDIETCRGAMAASGDIKADDYRIVFERSRGARVRELKLQLVPVVDGAAAMKAVCKVKGDEVVDFTATAA